MKKKVGIIVDGVNVSKQLHDLIELSRSSETYEITTLIVNDIEREARSLIPQAIHRIREQGISQIFAQTTLQVLAKAESLLLRHINPQMRWLNIDDVGALALQQITITPRISANGLVYNYADDDLKRLMLLECSVFVYNGRGLLGGNILNVCPHGIVSLNLGSGVPNRGESAGFWTVYHEHPRTEFTIQRHNDDAAAGEVLYRGFLPTSWTYKQNVLRLQHIATPFLHLVLEDISSPSSPRIGTASESYTPLRHQIPTPQQQLGYIAKTGLRLSRKALRKLTGRVYRWGVAYQFTEQWMEADLQHSTKIPNPKNRFLADPFVIKRGAKHYCFVEDYDYSTSRGSISVYEITRGGNTYIGVALAEAFHLSYPYLFEYDNNLYMCPESHERSDIRIYKCTNFPLKWELHTMAMKNVSAADTNIFKRGNHWWMLTNISRSGLDRHCSQLHIFYSDNPLGDDWQPHPQNPVVCDPLRARNGGLIRDGEDCFRVYQRQGFDMYGEAFGVAQISTLTQQDYEEQALFEREAHFFEEAKGTHTLNYSEGLLVVDYVELTALQRHE